MKSIISLVYHWEMHTGAMFHNLAEIANVSAANFPESILSEKVGHEDF